MNSFVTTTLFKYIVAMAATFIASQFGLEEGEVTAILTQLIGVAMAIWGAWESSRNKVVVDGKRITIEKLSPKAQHDVKEAVQHTERKSLWDILKGG